MRRETDGSEGGVRGRRGGEGVGRCRPTRSVCADYKTLNKITLESHGSVRARLGVPTCVTENDGDGVDGRRGKTRKAGKDGEGEMCSRHDVDTSRKKGTAHVYSNPSYIAFSY